MAFNWKKFPWTNLHDLNLDWIIQTVKTLEENLADAIGKFTEIVNTAITNTLTGSGDLTISKTGDVNITGNNVRITSGGNAQITGGAVISDGTQQLVLHSPNSNTSMTAHYSSGVLRLHNNQDEAAGVALRAINTPADSAMDNSDFAANVGYVKDAVNTVDSKLDTEITNRTSGDAALQSTIDNVIIPRLNKIPTKTSDLTNDSGFGTYSKPEGGIPESDLSFDVKTKLNARDPNIITIETENVDPLNPYKSSKSLTAIKNDFTHNIEQFVFYDNISYKLEKIITDNGVEKAVFHSTSRLVNDVLTYYTCEIYEGNFGYSAADFHTYTYTVTGGAVESVNGKTGAVTLNAEDVGAQRTLIAGSGITIVESENGDIIQSDASGSAGNGLVSFVDVAGGAPIASFTLNQTEDCEINVNDLNASLGTEVNNLRASLSNNYRTAAAQDAIDNTKIADAPVDGKEYARKNGNWHEITGAVESVNGKTGVVTLNATEIPSTKLSPADTISFLINGAFEEGLVELTRNGASASANDFISAVNSGSTVTVGLNDQSSTKVTFDERPVKYKITGDTLSLCFIAEIGHQYTPAIYVLSGTTSGTTVSTLVEHNFTDSFYQENYVSANDLPVSAPMSVEEYLEALEARIAALESK